MDTLIEVQMRVLKSLKGFSQSKADRILSMDTKKGAYVALTLYTFELIQANTITDFDIIDSNRRDFPKVKMVSPAELMGKWYMEGKGSAEVYVLLQGYPFHMGEDNAEALINLWNRTTN